MRRERSLWFGETALVVAIGLAWAALAAWHVSPYHTYLSHAQLEDAPLGPSWPLAVLVGGWTLMTVAMMLPASLPFFARVRLVTARRPGAGALVALAVGGYLLVWTLLGVGFNLGDLALHRAVAPGAVLHPLEELAAPLVFALAGAWQLASARRYYFHRPYLPRWIEMTVQPRWNALRGGARHGLDCAGSCWPLMLVMFAVGHGSLLLMALLGGLLVMQKNSAHGQQLRTLIGALLLVQAGMLTLAR
jgi:predicted metal-binding membrane protein